MTTNLKNHRLPDLLAKVHREIHADLSRILAQEDGLVVEQWRILAALAEGDGLSVSELSEKTFMTMSALSKTIDRMVFRALVHRRQDSADQRRVLIYITSFGREVLQNSTPGVDRFCEALSAALGTKKSQKLKNLLSEILTARAASE